MRIVRTKRYVKDLKRLGVATGERDALERSIAAAGGVSFRDCVVSVNFALPLAAAGRVAGEE